MPFELIVGGPPRISAFEKHSHIPNGDESLRIAQTPASTSLRDSKALGIPKETEVGGKIATPAVHCQALLANEPEFRKKMKWVAFRI